METVQEVKNQKDLTDTWDVPLKELEQASVKQEFFGHELIGELGRGGMGVVNFARNYESDIFCAIKVIPEDSTPKQIVRFQREADALQHFNHPNIVGFLYHDIDHHYFAMEYLDGHVFEALRVPKDPSDIADICRYTLQIAGALRHIHSEGILYRDVKPSNIMIVNGTAKLVDFGLIGADPGNALQSPLSQSFWDSNLTEDGMVIGTPITLAPEYGQCTSKLTPSNDLYSLGVTLYKVLTGNYPIEGNNMRHLLTLKVTTDPLPAKERNDAVSSELSYTLERTLERDPCKRFDTDSFCEALEKEIDRIQPEVQQKWLA